jgi:hypothetical protein
VVIGVALEITASSGPMPPVRVSFEGVPEKVVMSVEKKEGNGIA